eukprot:TRINITY_DN2598_c0_g1_i1.p1 TRINITY_DN2598_c0_g1~~TRINITY_DN2598_c0_g1_i1.p1  ORF type:complete len:211 (+),score=51.06 TRINITY_DN2598_c0_g1_i1:31-633(+)
MSQSVKVCLLGRSGVGKTCLARRFVRNVFGNTQITLGAGFLSKDIDVPDHPQPVSLKIWDTAGSEKFDAARPIYFRGSQAALICYDVTDLESFKGLNFFVQQLKRVEPECVMYVCATKIDLLNEGMERCVSKEEAESFAKQVNPTASLCYFETSAKESIGVAEPFESLGKDFAHNAPKASPDVLVNDFPSDNPEEESCSC